MRYKGQIEVVASIIEVIKFKFAVTINLQGCLEATVASEAAVLAPPLYPFYPLKEVHLTPTSIFLH